MTTEQLIRNQVAMLGEALVSAVENLLVLLPGPSRRPSDLSKQLSINKSISSRLLKALNAKNPITALYLMPGPEALYGLLDSARKIKLGKDAIEQVRVEVDRFSTLIREVAGDRGRLDTIISAWLPDVREKTELLNRQAVFKGMCQIKGFSKDVDVSAHFVHPSKTENTQDTALLAASLGLRRLRPGVEIVEIDNSLRADAMANQLRTLADFPVSDAQSVMLEQFCSQPAPKFDIQPINDGLTRFVLAGDQIGAQSMVDLAWSYASRGISIHGFGQEIAIPTKKIILNILLHKDVPQDEQLALRVYDTAGRGLVTKFDDPSRANDLLEPCSTIDYLGFDASKHHCTDIPHYIDMVQHVCNQKGWDPAAFKCYRCTIDFPVYGSHILIRHHTAKPH